MHELREIPLDKVISHAEFNARHNLGDLHELVASIDAVGVQEPVLVKALADEQYEIFAGFRRLEASKLSKHKSIPAIVHPPDSVSDQMMFTLNVIENIQREDLNPIDEALAFNRLKKEFKMSDKDIVACVGIRKQRLQARLRLLKCSAVIQEALQDGRITAQAALEIDRLPKDKQAKYVNVAVELSAVKLKNLVDKELDKISKQADPGEPAEKKTDDAADQVTAWVRGLRKNMTTVCFGLGYPEDVRQRMKDVNFRLLEADDLGAVFGMFEDLAEGVPDDVDINAKAEQEIVKAVEDEVYVLDTASPMVRQVLIGAIKDRAQELALDRSTSNRRPKVTYALAQEVLAEFFAGE